MIPTGDLRLEVQPMAKPKPIGCGVFVDGQMVAVLTLENVRAIAQRIAELEAQRS